LEGWQPWLLTLTLRHTAACRLSDLFGVLGKAWGRLTSGREWAAVKRQGVEYIRGYDITHGGNGWHPHIHAVFLFAPGVSDPAATARRLLDRWIAAVQSLGGDVVADALDAQPCADAGRAASYACHIAGVWEAVGGVKKDAKRGRTVMDLAAAAVSGDEAAARLWIEYARSTRGRRAVVVSRGLSLSDAADATADADADPPDAAPPDADAAAVEVVAVIRSHLLRQLDPYLGDALAAAAVSASAAHAVLTRALGPPSPATWWPPDPDEKGGP
jgi:hypothetical protein